MISWPRLSLIKVASSLSDHLLVPFQSYTLFNHPYQSIHRITNVLHTLQILYKNNMNYVCSSMSKGGHSNILGMYSILYLNDGFRTIQPQLRLVHMFKKLRHKAY